MNRAIGSPLLEMNSPQDASLQFFLTEKLNDPVVSQYVPYIEELHRLLKGRSYAAVMYGSCLSATTKSASSSPDFFIIVDDYASFFTATPFHGVISKHLPPNIYHFKVGGVQSKYSVISYPHLVDQASPAAKDMYLLGRFSKRLAWVSSNTNVTLDHIAKIQYQAMSEVVKKSRALMGESYSLDELCKMCIRLSYLGDVRVEAADKIDRLFAADAEFYRRVFHALAQTAERQSSSMTRHEVESFLARSRRRAKYRWPKAMITATSWLDYVAEKIERTQGIKIELTPWQRKLWFIYGWKYVFQLRKKKPHTIRSNCVNG